MKYLTKLFKHIKLVCRHKHYVFLAACEGGIPIRGFFHDMSKFSPIELFNSAQYYTGCGSPIDKEKASKGYSYAWLHHRGHNPHHWEYWIENLSSGGEALKIPSKFIKEMICDWIGSGKAYNKTGWTRESPYYFFMNKVNNGLIKMHPESLELCANILHDYAFNSTYSLKDVFKHNFVDSY